MTNLSKGKTVDTTNLQLGELIKFYFDLYNVTSILGFTSMLILVCAKNKMIWLFTTGSTISPVCSIHFILTKLKNEQHIYKRVIVDKYGSLENSTYFTNLLVDNFIISMETIGGDASWINLKNEIHNVIIHKNFFCAAETSAEVYMCRLYSALDNTSNHFSWYGNKSIIHKLRTLGCGIYPITSSPKKLYDSTQEVSFMGYKNSISTMKWWYSHTKKLEYYSSENFNITINLGKYGTRLLNYD